MRQFVISKRPANAAECAEFADLYFEISKIGRETEKRQVGPSSNVVGGQARFRPNSEFTRPAGNPGASATFRPVGHNGKMNDGRFRNPTMLQPNGFSRPNLQAATSNMKQQQQQQQSGYFNQGQGKRGTYFANKIRMPNASIACRNNVDLCDDNNVKHDVCDDQCDDAVDNDDCMMCEDDGDCNNRFFVPVYVNDIKCTASRDSSNFGPVLVDEILVPKEHLNFDKPIKCYGVFDNGRTRTVPTAEVTISSPWFGTNDAITVIAAGTKLPANMFCILGNNFFFHNKLRDIIHVEKSRKPQGNEAGDRPTDETVVSQQDFDKGQQSHFGRNHTSNSVPVTQTADNGNVCKQTRDNARDTDTSPLGASNNIQSNGLRSLRSTRHDTDSNSLNADAERGSAVAEVNNSITADSTVPEINGTTPISSETSGRPTDQRTAAALEQYNKQTISDMTDPDGQGGKTDGQDADTTLATEKLKPAAITYDREQPTKLSTDQINVITTRQTHKSRLKTDDRGQPALYDSDPTIQPQEQNEMQRTIMDVGAIDLSEIKSDDRNKHAQSSADEFRAEQLRDKSLESFWTRAKAGTDQFKIINSLLYRKIDNKINSADDYALVVRTNFGNSF